MKIGFGIFLTCITLAVLSTVSKDNFPWRWKFDEGLGTTFSNETGIGKGTLEYCGWGEGVSGSAVWLKNENSAVIFSRSIFEGVSDAFTIDFQFQADRIRKGYLMEWKGPHGIFVRMREDGILNIGILDGSWKEFFFDRSPLKTGQWYDLRIAIGEGSMLCFLDGTLLGSVSLGKVNFSGNGELIFSGRQLAPWGGFFGKIDEVMITRKKQVPPSFEGEQYCRADFQFNSVERIYHEGDPVKVKIAVKECDGQLLRKGCCEVVFRNQRKSFDLTRNNPFFFEETLGKQDSPGLAKMIAQLRMKPGAKLISLRDGDLTYFWVEPEKLNPAVRAPADFREFWMKQLDREREKPLDPKLEELSGFSKPGQYKVYKVSFSAPRGRIYGFLSVPDRGKGPYPAEMTVCWAGPGWKTPPYFSDKHVILAMNIHDFDPDIRDTAYPELSKKALLITKYQDGCSYKFLGWPEPEKMYYVHGIVGNVRALEWLAARSDVDAGKIGYFGTSQGGAFGLILAGLSPRFAAVVSDVPALCNLSGYLMGKGFSGWGGFDNAFGKTPETQHMAGYFDAANFAAFIRSPVRVIASERDQTCSPNSVRVTYNRIPAFTDKAFCFQQNGTHTRNKEVFKAQCDWMRSLLDRKPETEGKVHVDSGKH